MRLCLARSGDKGDTANIGVIARSEAIYAWMLEHLTPAFVKRYFDDVCQGEVERFELPNLLAVNFLLHRSLGGGGTLSLLLDAQGKTYAQFLLAATVEVPESLLEPRGARGAGAPPFEQPQGVPSESRGTQASGEERGEGAPATN